MCADKQSTDWFNSISRTLRWNEREKQKSFVVVEEDHEPPDKTKKTQRRHVSEKEKKSWLHCDDVNETHGDEDEDDDEEERGDEDEDEEEFDIDE